MSDGTMIRKLPRMSYEVEAFISATTFGTNLCVRRSYWLDDLAAYPEVAGFIERYGLEVVNEFEEPDEYMAGGAIVTAYRVPDRLVAA